MCIYVHFDMISYLCSWLVEPDVSWFGDPYELLSLQPKCPPIVFALIGWVVEDVDTIGRVLMYLTTKKMQIR